MRYENVKIKEMLTALKLLFEITVCNYNSQPPEGAVISTKLEKKKNHTNHLFL